MSIGGKDVEVDSVLLKNNSLAVSQPLNAVIEPSPQAVNNYLPLKSNALRRTIFKPENLGSRRTLYTAAPRSSATGIRWKNPMLLNTAMPKESNMPLPRHDPNATEAIVMKRPENIPRGKQIVDVVVDPILAQHLREHQREGVKFMYECVLGMRNFEGQGTILADEMGLGKTLQTIALLWTLLKQNPIYGDQPLIKKALIVCPVTLIDNWRKEFRKWLGAERIGVFVAGGTKTRLTDFTMGRSYSIMIIGYEKLRTVQEELKKGNGIDIVVADEGHRLKTAKNKSALAIKSLSTLRRLILSGTPIQNDLSEFYMMVDFVNPGLLGTIKNFTKEFVVPIVRSRQPHATQSEKETGEARSEGLTILTSPFILRRTVDILSKYLPSKTEYVLLCRPTTAQISVYRYVLACPAFQVVLGNSEASLQLITILKKVCNSPVLLSPKDASKPSNPITEALHKSIPSYLLRNNAASTKIRVLDQLLHSLHTTTNEKIVLVSNYTSTLDLLSTLLTSLSLTFLRLDGSTPSCKRQGLVDSFNRTPASKCFAFLLSAKSGGMGLNLVGASRLVLFDVDWNPATDLQAMARIHRDGQKKECVIYRFLMAGGIDEKIWQRQITKLGLASNIMDQMGGTSSFTKEELCDLFRLDEGIACQTHLLSGCSCNGCGLPNYSHTIDNTRQVLEGGEADAEDHLTNNITLVSGSKVNVAEQEVKSSERAQTAKIINGNAKMHSLMAYSHIDPSKFATKHDTNIESLIEDKVLLKVLKDEGNRITYVFRKSWG